MAKTERKPLTFNVSTDTYNHFAQLFPHETLQGKPDCSESNLLAILEPYENPQESNSDLLRQCNELNRTNATLQEQNEKLAAEVKRLQAQVEEQDREYAANNNQHAADYQQSQEQLQQLTAQNNLLTEQNTALQEQVRALQSAEINWDKIKSTIQPFTVALLEETAQRLTVKQGHEITPMQILVDMFLRYTIERWNEWFYKFVLKDSDIIAIAQTINPDIRTIDQIRKAVLKK